MRASKLGFGLRSARMVLNGLAAGAFLLVCAETIRADTVADFYTGKTVRILVGSSAGGEYDVLGRLIGRHIGRHIPGNPSIIVVNMPGAFGVPMANHLYSIAEPDGTHLGMVNNNMPNLEITGGNVQFKTTRFGWIGSIAPVENTIVVWAAKGVKTIDDARKTEVIAGAIGRGNIQQIFPTLMNDLVGTKFKVVTGYRGGRQLNLAIERGEVDARSTSWTSLNATNAGWIKAKKVHFLVQAGPRSKEKDLQSLPSIEDLARNADDRAVIDMIFAGARLGRPLAAPPGVPPERLAALRKAFAATMADRLFLQEAQKRSISVDPVSGEALQTILAAMHRTPKATIQRAKKYTDR
jgi:tripartite-type tricarboxylate transporter receptor subunit TctC